MRNRGSAALKLEDDLIALQRDGPRLVSLQKADQGRLRSGVRRHPEIGEGVGRDELPDL